MKIVIDIPEESYNIIKSDLYNTFPAEMKEWGLEAIRNGTPLPKGHGALKDADAIRKTISESIEECQKWADEVKGGEMYARVSQSLGTFVECSLRIKNAPTIIEADKAESEDKLDGNPVDIDKAIEHYEGTLEALKDIKLEVDG